MAAMAVFGCRRASRSRVTCRIVWVRAASQRQVGLRERFAAVGARRRDDPRVLPGNHRLQPPQEPRRPREAGVGPVHFLLGRRLEEDVEADRVGAVPGHRSIRIHHVALALRHLGAVLDDHALAQLANHRLVHVHQSEVPHDLGPEAAVDEVQDGVLHAPDVEIDGKPRPRLFRVERRGIVLRVEIAVEVPGRVHEGVHRVGLPTGAGAALGARRLQPLPALLENRTPLAGDPDVRRQLDGQILLGDRRDSAVGAMDHRDRRAPVTLPGHSPVVEPPGRPPAPEALALGVTGHRQDRLGAGEAAELARFDHGAVLHECGLGGIRRDGAIGIRDHDAPDLDAVAKREGVGRARRAREPPSPPPTRSARARNRRRTRESPPRKRGSRRPDRS